MNPPTVGRFLVMSAVLVWAGTAGGQEGESVPRAEDLIAQLKSAWSGADLELSAGMTIKAPGKPTREAAIVILRDDRGRVRLEFLEPEKDRGKIILTVDGETWLYLPRAEKTVKVPAGKNMLAGGILMDDLFHGDFTGEDAVVELEDDEIRLEFTYGRGRKSYRSIVYLDRDSRELLRREIYNRSGKLLRYIEVQESRTWRRWSVPSRVLYRDMLRKGMETIIDVSRIRGLSDADRALISLQALKRESGPGGEDGTTAGRD
jgi:hypothetical protein